MGDALLLPAVLEVTTAAWAVTVGLILRAVGLRPALVRPHAVGFREAVIQSVVYIGVAVAFGVGFGFVAGWDHGAEYFAGYVVEKSLSVDNLFVFVVIMTTFAVPAEYQQKVLTIGILIALGAALIAAFSFMFLRLRVLLMVTARSPTAMTTAASSRERTGAESSRRCS